MSHGEILPRIDYKLNFIEQHKPKWYVADEKQLAAFDRDLDNQVNRIGRKMQQKGYKPPFKLALPEGIKAAERGR
jgi:hypothetical protein